MASIRGSKRTIKVTAACGHITDAIIYGTSNGAISRKNIAEAQTVPCLDCRYIAASK
jgi:hypothetical protein